LGRRPHTRLDLLRPNTARRVEERQQAQKRKHDLRARTRSFKEGDTVFVKNFGSGCQWLPGKILDVSGPVSFRVQLEDGRWRRCHQDHLRLREVEGAMSSDMSQIAPEDSILISPTTTSESRDPVTTSVSSGTPPEVGPPTEQTESPTTTSQPSASNPSAQRYPRRNRKPRDHFEPGIN